MGQLRKLLLGETLTLPLGLAVVLVAALAVRRALPAVWDDLGGFALLVGVLVVLVLSTRASTRPRRARG